MKIYIIIYISRISIYMIRERLSRFARSPIIARKEGGAWERLIINAPQAKDRGGGQGTAEVNGAGPSAMVVEKDVVGPSAMVVESDSVGPSPMVTEVGRYAQSSRRMDS